MALEPLMDMALERMALEPLMAMPWEPNRWRTCAAALGPDVWAGEDDVGQLEPTADDEDGVEKVVLALTTEAAAPVLSALHGGAGAANERKGSKRGASTLTAEPFSSAHAWLMPLPVDARLHAVVADFPEVARRSIIEALPTVFANSCTNEGMAKVLLWDSRLWRLPYAELYERSRLGFDDGLQILAGDQLTLARVDSVKTLLATSAITMRVQLDALETANPRYEELLATLTATEDAYMQICAYVKKVGLLHFEFHQVELIAGFAFPFILRTLSLLVKARGIDMRGRDFTRYSDFLVTVEAALWHSLFDAMRAEGAYPSAAEVALPEGGVDPTVVEEIVGAFLESKATSDDRVTAATTALLRLVHEHSALHVALRHDDFEYIDRCSMPTWLPLFCAAGPIFKHLYSQLSAYHISCAPTTSLVPTSTQHACVVRVANYLHTHKLDQLRHRT
jgi:hypothetical protein